MAIAITLKEYLADRRIDYDVITHRETASASRSAEACNISGDRLAKAVIVKDAAGYLIAVLPASHHIRLGQLSRLLARDLDLASEQEASALFPDCATGAFPALGSAYGLEVVVDDSLARLPDVYLEGGDHANLLRLGGEQFRGLTEQARHGSFSAHD